MKFKIDTTDDVTFIIKFAPDYARMKVHVEGHGLMPYLDYIKLLLDNAIEKGMEYLILPETKAGPIELYAIRGDIKNYELISESDVS